MGEAIRWDTIMSRPTDSAPGIASAAGLINNGFNAIQGVLRENQNVQNQNFDNHTKLNTAAFMDAVSKYQNPDDIKKAMSQGGELDQLRATLGPNINHDMIRGAAEARVNNLMQQKQQEITFNHAMTDEATAGAVQQFKAARLNKDQAGMDAALNDYKAKNGRDLSGLIAYGDARGWEEKNREMTVRTSNDQHNTSVSGIEHDRAMEGIGRTQANAAVSQAAAAQQQAKTSSEVADYTIRTGTADRKTAQAAGMAAAIKSSLDQKGNLYSKEGMYTGNQADELRKFMVDTKFGGDNPDKQSDAINRLNEVLKNGVKVTDQNGRPVMQNGKPMIIRDIPMSAVKAALAASENDLINFGWNSAPGKNMQANLEAILGRATTYKDGTVRSKALDDLREFTDATNRVTENAPAIAPARMPANTYGGGKRK